MPQNMTTPAHCPGFQELRNLKSFVCKCPECGKENEIFSDEFNISNRGGYLLTFLLIAWLVHHVVLLYSAIANNCLGELNKIVSNILEILKISVHQKREVCLRFLAKNIASNPKDAFLNLPHPIS